MKARGGERARWSVSNRLQVIQAVMQVEAEIIRETAGPTARRSGALRGRTKCKAWRKWERINNLLPPEIRETKRTPGKKYRVESLFGGLIRSYRDVSRNSKCRSRKYTLREEDLSILKKREDIWNAWVSEVQSQCPKAGSSKGVEACSDSGNYSEQLSATGDSNRVRTSAAWSTRRPAASVFTDHTDDSGRTGQEALHSRYNAKDTGKDDSAAFEKSEKRLGANSSRGCEWRSVSASDGPGSPILYPSQSTSNAVSEFKDTQAWSAAPSRPGVRNQVEIRAKRKHWSSSARPSSNSQPRASSPFQKRATSMTHLSSDSERIDSIMSGVLRRISLEFSLLKSWVQNSLIPVGRKDLSNSLRTSAVIRSTKTSRSRVRLADESPDGLTCGGLSRGMDLRIQASFQNLRMRFAHELKNVSVGLAREVAEMVMQEIHSAYGGPDYSGHGGTRGQSPPGDKSSSPDMHRCRRPKTARQGLYSRR